MRIQRTAKGTLILQPLLIVQYIYGCIQLYCCGIKSTNTIIIFIKNIVY